MPPKRRVKKAAIVDEDDDEQDEEDAPDEEEEGDDRPEWYWAGDSDPSNPDKSQDVWVRYAEAVRSKIEAAYKKGIEP